MWTTNKLLQTALQKGTNSSRQPEEAVVTYRHAVGENGLGLNQPWRRRQDVWWHADTWTDVQWRQWWWIFGFWINLLILGWPILLLVLKPGVANTQVYTVYGLSLLSQCRQYITVSSVWWIIGGQRYNPHLVYQLKQSNYLKLQIIFLQL